MTTFVLVPGACHGGWWYRPLVDELVRRAHDVHALTLRGLAEGDAVADGSINLDTHIDEVTSAVVTAAGSSGSGVVLVGHSYGGSVISGVADRVPELIGALVYIDAFVPDDGDSCFTMTDDEQRRWFIDGGGRTGAAVDPLPFFDSRARPHPLAAFVQRSKLTGAWRSVAVKHYLAATGWLGRSPFADITEKVRADPSWTVHEWPTGHDVLREGPDRLLQFLIGL